MKAFLVYKSMQKIGQKDSKAVFLGVWGGRGLHNALQACEDHRLSIDNEVIAHSAVKACFGWQSHRNLQEASKARAA
eukprot:2975886-Amphidinium_carterae.1